MTSFGDDITRITYKYYKDDPNTEKIQTVVEYTVGTERYTVTSIPFNSLSEASACAHWIREQAYELALESFRVLIETELDEIIKKGAKKIPIH